MDTETQYISKKLAIAALALSYGGMLVLVCGALFVIEYGIDAMGYRFLALVPGMFMVFCGSMVMTKKCRCPCLAEDTKGRATNVEFHGLVNIRAIRRGYYKCPRCGCNVEFK